MARTQIAVLASGRGTDFQSLVDARDRGELPVDLAVLVCNVPGAPVLQRAKKAGVPSVVIDHRTYGKDREGFERDVVKVLRDRGAHLVVFAGFMRLVSPYFINESHAHRDALAAGAKVSGLTIHFVDTSLDGGPIILQKAVPVRDDDTEETLAARILEQEHIFLPIAVRLFAEGRLRIEGRRVHTDTRGLNLPPMA